MNVSSQTAPFSDYVPEEWVISRRSLSSGGVTIEHHFEDPGELAVPGFSQHSLLITMSAGNKSQLTQLDNQTYEGANPKGAFWMATANTPGRWIWDCVDECIAVIIDPSHLQIMAMQTQGIEPTQVELENVTFGLDPQIAFFAQSYRQEMVNRNLGGQLQLDSITNLLLLHLLRNYAIRKPIIRNYSGRLASRRLKKVLDYIDTHLDQAIELADLAAIADMSKYHFSSLFKQSTGLPPYRYVLQQRIKRAQRLLSTTSLPISTVALNCGFADQSHLTKHFTKSVGVTPRIYREEF